MQAKSRPSLRIVENVVRTMIWSTSFMIVISRCQSMSKVIGSNVPSSGLGMRAVSVMGDQRHLHDATSCRPYGQLLTDSGGQSTPAAWPASWIRSLWKSCGADSSRVMNEIDEAIVRTSFSTIVGESRDFAYILTDEAGRSLCQSSFSPANFCVVLPRTAKALLERFPVETLQEGDVLATNDPWIGTGHLPDYVMISPVFRENQVVAFIGSSRTCPTSAAMLATSRRWTCSRRASACLPAKLYVLAANRTRTLFDLIEANCRVPDLVLGDLRAMIGTHRLGASRLREFLDDYGLTTSAARARDPRSLGDGDARADLRPCRTGATNSASRSTDTKRSSICTRRIRYQRDARSTSTTAAVLRRRRQRVDQLRLQHHLRLDHVPIQMRARARGAQQRGVVQTDPRRRAAWIDPEHNLSAPGETASQDDKQPESGDLRRRLADRGRACASRKRLDLAVHASRQRRRLRTLCCRHASPRGARSVARTGRDAPRCIPAQQRRDTL